jgi:predicted nuclease of predicted toxin-antitoxin system
MPSEVFRLANDQNAILLTADKDFGAIVFQQRRVTSGVVLIRLHGMSSEHKAELVADLFDKHSERLRHAFTVLTPDNIRIRPGPHSG